MSKRNRSSGGKPRAIRVTRERFVKALDSYPRPLATDVYRIGEPPLMTFNDFTLGNWPEGMVAHYTIGENPSDFTLCGSYFKGKALK